MVLTQILFLTTIIIPCTFQSSINFAMKTKINLNGKTITAKIKLLVISWIGMLHTLIISCNDVDLKSQE